MTTNDEAPERIWIRPGDAEYSLTPKFSGDDIEYVRADTRTTPPVDPREWQPIDRAGYQRRLFDECVAAKWDPDKRNSFAEEIAHLHEELSEAFRAWRLYKDFNVHYSEGGKPEGIPIELADVMIGLFYNAELHGFDLFAAVEEKHQYNLTRNYVNEGRQLHALTQPTASPASGALLASDAVESSVLHSPESSEYERGFTEGMKAAAEAIYAAYMLTPPGSQQEIQSQQIKVK